MKRVYLTAIFVLPIAFAACKKQDGDTSYYFTFNIGSKVYSIDSAIVHIYSQSNATSSFEILGYTTSHHYNLNAFGFNPLDTSIIGTYVTIQNPTPKRVLTAGGFISSELTDANFGNYPINYDGRYSFTISEKTATFISGTFSGTLTSTSLKTVDISNGKFKLRY